MMKILTLALSLFFLAPSLIAQKDTHSRNVTIDINFDGSPEDYKRIVSEIRARVSAGEIPRETAKGIFAQLRENMSNRDGNEKKSNREMSQRKSRDSQAKKKSKNRKNRGRKSSDAKEGKVKGKLKDLGRQVRKRDKSKSKNRNALKVKAMKNPAGKIESDLKNRPRHIGDRDRSNRQRKDSANSLRPNHQQRGQSNVQPERHRGLSRSNQIGQVRGTMKTDLVSRQKFWNEARSRLQGAVDSGRMTRERAAEASERFRAQRVRQMR